MTAATEVIGPQARRVEIKMKGSRLPNVCVAYDATWATDFMIAAKFGNKPELSGFTQSLPSMPYAGRTNTQVVLTTMKEDFRFPLIQEKQSAARPAQSTLIGNQG